VYFTKEQAETLETSDESMTSRQTAREKSLLYSKYFTFASSWRQIC